LKGQRPALVHAGRAALRIEPSIIIQALIVRGPELYLSNAVSWSPDGQWLVYHTHDRLALVQVATGLKLPLANTIGWSDPTWQP